jgi:hypothetical protein
VGGGGGGRRNHHHGRQGSSWLTIHMKLKTRFILLELGLLF